MQNVSLRWNDTFSVSDFRTVRYTYTYSRRNSQHFHILHWCDYCFYGDEILVHWYTQCQTIQSYETLIQISESREWMNGSLSLSFCYCFTGSDSHSLKIPLTMHDFAYGSKISHQILVRWTQTRVSLFFLLFVIIG